MLIDSHAPEHEAAAQAIEERCQEHGGGVPEVMASKWRAEAGRGRPGKESI